MNGNENANNWLKRPPRRKASRNNTSLGFEVYSGYNKHKPTSGIPTNFDITNYNEVLNAIIRCKPDVIVHAAALTDVDKCEQNKDLALKVNYHGTLNIVKACEPIKPFFIYISADCVFDGKKGMYSEDDEPNPINFYGYSKLMEEKAVTTSNLEYCIIRSSVIYGSKPARGKINFALWIIEKLRNKEAVSVITDQYVSPTLNTNLSGMIVEVAEKRINGILHLAGATRISRYEFAQKIAEIFSLDKTLIKPITMNDINWVAERPRDSSLNVSKAINIFKNKPMNLDESLKRLKVEMEGVA